jgi:outer membrane protein TolC
VQQLEDGVRAAVADALDAVAAAAERLPQARAGLDAAGRSLRISEARYQAGSALAIEVLEAEDAVARARLDLADAVVAFNRAQLDLLVATSRVERERLVAR